MTTATRPFPACQLRASDADRDLAIAELSEHFETGRLSQDEFDERSARALRARTGQELTELFADLPGGGRPGDGASPVSRGGLGAGLGRATTGPGRPGRSRAGSTDGGCRPAGLAIVGVVAAIAIASAIGGVAHVGFGWLIPLLIVALIIRRAARR